MSIESIKIRPADPYADAEMLARLARETFYDAFHAHPKNAPEDLAVYMSEAFSFERISAELIDEKSLFLIAESDGQAVGYARMIFESREREVSAEKPVELNRLYAKTEFIGRGVGRKLMDECFKIALERGCDAMWLGVWEFNPRARRFYEKLGFREIGSHVFQLGSDAQTDLLMQKNLSPGV